MPGSRVHCLHFRKLNSRYKNPFLKFLDDQEAWRNRAYIIGVRSNKLLLCLNFARTICSNRSKSVNRVRQDRLQTLGFIQLTTNSVT
jgi:hypothetical protein